MSKNTVAEHIDTHKRLLSNYRALNGARYGSFACGGLLATSLMGLPDPNSVALGLTGLSLLPVGYLLGFPAQATAHSMKANWKRAFVGASWRTAGGEIGVVQETDEFGNDLKLSFKGLLSSKTFSLASLEPATDKARALVAPLADANPHVSGHPFASLFCPLGLAILAMLLLPPALAIGCVWLVLSCFSYFMCGAFSGTSGDNGLLSRVAKTRWQVLDGRIGFVRAAESRGNGDTGWVDYLTIGFEDGSEFYGEKSEMVPVHN
ncbi:hypothetical protein OIU34_22215 [Pararhizobium sp. BT-229]|uniref:hypothetical protein n=1 Tax=Pararhizobium sp. BT-229 TaxID=2986923 RepID=UPI0021F7ABB7|nr:hypothetical protein [Pararhizobium sp. BT-229]MCV9964609.1 hypothetical protein [Pararhizobium sp. BT-229]